MSGIQGARRWAPGFATLIFSTAASAQEATELGSIEEPLALGCAVTDPVGLRVSYGVYAHEGSEAVAVLFEDVVTAPTSTTTLLAVGPADDADFEAVAAGLEAGLDPTLTFGVNVEMVPTADSPPGAGCMAGGAGAGLAIPLPEGATVEWVELSLSPFSFVATAPGFTSVDPWDATLILTAYGTVEPVGPPVADAGPDQEVLAGALVQLDGSGSWDPAGTGLEYRWTLVDTPPGSVAWVEGEDTSTPAFVADSPGTYELELVVVDAGGEASEPDAIAVTAVNHAPVADAGLADAVAVGETAYLDGTASADPDGHPLSYAWTLEARPFGSYAGLYDASSPTPSILLDWPGAYVFALVVSDGWEDSDPAYVQIDALNTAPVAVLGADDSAWVGDVVHLSGSESYDPDGHALSMLWTLTERPAASAATLSSASSPEASFAVDQPGLYGITLEVCDPYLTCDSAVAVVTVPTAAELLAEAIQVTTEAPDAAFARGKRATVLARLDDIGRFLGRRAAVAKVEDLLQHLRGCESADGAAAGGDWVVACDTQLELRALLLGLIATIG